MNAFSLYIGSFPFTVYEENGKIIKIKLGEKRSAGSLTSLFEELREKFELISRGKRVSFDNIPVDLELLSDFERHVLFALRDNVPWGRVISYSGLARLLGMKSGRAIGRVMARNPFPMIFPCHRVVRKDGGIGGYGGGIQFKKFLLELEGVKFDGNRIIRKYFVQP